ncbi:unnamed protein product [Clonostachys chloroleuca]|uniref:Uncharacterized protein n=1 Tax=Clonostachys chloroleuca TaxID=1926264 RepID=A0AA35V968_9HYPO|nr:unnamed protein product [Clonostachys chloroleuca]
MAIPHLCNDILLRIVELCDLETILTLKKVPAFNDLLTFEKSIAKNMYRMSIPVAPDEVNSPFLLKHDLNALEIASTYEIEEAKRLGRQDYPQSKPALVPMNTFLSVEEHQRRDHEIEVLLRAGSLLINEGPGGNPHSWPAFPNTNSKSLLQALLRRNMARCDVLAEMEARAMFEVAKPSGLCSCTLESEDAALRHNSAMSVSCNNWMVIDSRLVPGHTLKIRTEYLQSLPLDSLIELYFLGTYLSECRHQKTFEPIWDLEYFACEHAFQEAVLSHGSWAVFNEFRGSGDRSKHARQIREQIRKRMSLRPHEDPTKADVWHLDGLRTALHHMLLRRLEGQDIQEIGGLRTEVYKRVGAMIGAPEAFENPPSLEGRPYDVQNVSFE